MLHTRMLRIYCTLLIMMGLTVLLCPSAFSASNSQDGNEVSLEDVAPGQVDSVLAKLSDEQVRSLLIAELQKDASNQQGEGKRVGGIYGVFVRWLQMMNAGAGDMDNRIDQVRGKIWQVHDDLLQVALKLGGKKGLAGFWLAVVMVAGVLLSAYGIELLFRTGTRKIWGEFLEKDAPQLDGLYRFWAADLRILPAIVNIIIFVFAAFMIFVFVPGFGRPEIRMFFLALLVPLIVVRFF